MTNTNIKVRIFRVTFITLIVFKSVGSDIELLLVQFSSVQLIRIDGVASIVLLGDNVQFIPDIHARNYNSNIVLFNTMSIASICIVMCA